MAKTRRIAPTSENQPKLAELYKAAFAMAEVRRHSSADGTEAIYLSDGYINLASLPARGRPAEKRGQPWA